MNDIRDLGKWPENSMPTTAPESIHSTSKFDDADGHHGFAKLHIEPVEDQSRTGRIIGGIFLVAALCGMGVYAYTAYSNAPKPAVADNSLPAPAAPRNVAAVQPPPAPAPDTSALQNSPYATAPSAPANDNATPAAPATNAAPAESKPVKPAPLHARAAAPSPVMADPAPASAPTNGTVTAPDAAPAARRPHRLRRPT